MVFGFFAGKQSIFGSTLSLFIALNSDVTPDESWNLITAICDSRDQTWVKHMQASALPIIVYL